MLLTSDRLGLEDLFDPSQWGGFFATVTPSQLLLAMLISLLVGIFLFVLYRKTFNGSVYSLHFNVALVALTMITSIIMLLVSSNLVLSLGALGALSIVRFRTPIKDTMDIVYVFFAIGEGIVIGTGLYGVVFLSTFIIGATLYGFHRYAHHRQSYLLVIRAPRDQESKIRSTLAALTLKYKSQSLTPTQCELDVLFVDERIAQQAYGLIRDLDHMTHVSLIHYEN